MCNVSHVAIWVTVVTVLFIKEKNGDESGCHFMCSAEAHMIIHNDHQPVAYCSSWHS